MTMESFPRVGDVVYVRDDDDYNDDYNASGYITGVVIEKKAGIDRYTSDGWTTEEGYTYRIDLGEGCVFIKTCRRGEESRLFFPSRDAVVEQIEKELEAVRAITASPYIDWNLMKRYQQDLASRLFEHRDPVKRLKKLEQKLLSLLQCQFGILKLEDLYETYGEKTCVEFLNNSIAFLLKKEEQRREELRRNGGGIRGYFKYIDSLYIDNLELSPETVEEFVTLACEESIQPCSKPLTIRKFLKMCRVAYDAAGVTERYPPDASDIFIYCHERDLSFAGDFRGFEGQNWDSPEVFRSFHSILRYHPEELQFGGMRLWIRNLRGGWVGYFSTGDCQKSKQAILAYVALRRNGYPITCSRPEELLKEARVIR